MEYYISKKMREMKPSAIREIFKSLGAPGAISLAAGNPSPESFPVDFIAKTSERILREDPTTALQYSVTEGYPKLREDVALRLRSKFKIDTEKNITVITSGGQQGIELACKAVCDEGDAIICENPSFIGALNAFRSLGVTPLGAEMCEDGIDIEMTERLIKDNPRVRMLYLIPTFQNPSGITTSFEKRKAVYELARKYDLLIIEDNPYGELRFSGIDVPTIKSFDEDGRVIYCGSFSKILSAGMRVGFFCAPEPVAQKMIVAKQVEDVHTNIFFQMICHSFMTEFDLEGHLDKIRKLYFHKASLMVDCLDKYMPQDVKHTVPEGGLFLWCTLPDRISLDEFMKKSAEAKVFVVPGTAFNCDMSAKSSSFRLNYSVPTDEEIEKGIYTLSKIVK